MHRFEKKVKFLAINILCLALVMMAFTGCDEDDGDDTPDPDPDPMGTITASDQTISQNTIMVSSVEMDEDGWIVVHKTTESGVEVPDIISEPVAVSAGTNDDVEIHLMSTKSVSNDPVTIEDGDEVVLMLHTDDGEIGTYEFDGSNGLDAPLMNEDDQPITTTITINSPGFEIADQALVDNTVTFSSVDAAVDGWIVVHNQNQDGGIMLPDVIGKTKVEAGTTEDVVVTLDEGNYAIGQSLYPMLHIENPADEEYTFPTDQTQDVPEIFSFDESESVILVNEISVLEE